MTRTEWCAWDALGTLNSRGLERSAWRSATGCEGPHTEPVHRWFAANWLPLLGSLAVVLGGAASLTAEPPVLKILGVLAAVLTLVVLWVQHRSAQPKRVVIRSDEWTPDPDGTYVHVIARRVTGGRRHATLTMPLLDGGEEEVFSDVRILANGDVRVYNGEPSLLVVYLR